MNKNKEKKEIEKKKKEKNIKTNNDTVFGLRNILDLNLGIKISSLKSSFNKNQQEFIKKYLGDGASKIRFYFIRHGDTGVKGHQTPIDSLLETEIERFKGVSKKLKKLGVNNKNTYIFYDERTTRVKESACFMQKNLAIPKDKTLSSIDGLDTTDKKHPNYSYRYLESSIVTSGFAFKLLKKMKTKKNFNIIMVLHRANIASLEQTYTNEGDTPLSLDFKGFIHGEIREIDIQVSGKGKNIENQKELIFLTSENQKNIIKFLKKEKSLKEIIKGFKSQKIQIWELQNYINAYFRATPKLFKKYVFSENYDISLFCIVNLIQIGEIDFVKKNFQKILDIIEDDKIILFINITLNQCSNEEKKDLIKIITNKPNLTKGLKTQSLEYFVNYEKNVKKNIKKIRNKSLDQKLQNGKDVILSLFFEKRKYNKIDNLVGKKGLILIEGEAGVGKTSKLLEIMEYLKPSDTERDLKQKKFKKRKVPIYINLGEISDLETLKEKIEVQSDLFGKKGYNFIYLFDGLDELKTDNLKIEIFYYVRALSKNSKVILTSRNLTLIDALEKKNEIERIKIKTLKKEQVKKYIEKHLTNKQQYDWEKLKKKSFMKKIETNPLMLSIVCNLLISSEKLEEINTIGELYEKIIDIRLKDWEEKKHNRETNDFKIKYRKKLLSEIAYKSMIFGKNLDYKEITSLIENKDLYSLSIPYSKNIYDIECLNILFKSKEEGDYLFVHESFREYFIAKYYLDNIIGEQLDWKSFLTKNILKINFEILNFLCDFLNKEQNKEKKKLFLSKIKKNEDRFIFNKKQILFILHKLSKEKLEEYINNIIIDVNILFILDFLGRNKTLQKTKKVFLKNKRKILLTQFLDSKTIPLLGKKKLKKIVKIYYEKHENKTYFDTSFFSSLLKNGSTGINLAEKIYKKERQEDRKRIMLIMLTEFNTSKWKKELEKTLRNTLDIFEKTEIVMTLLKVDGKKRFKDLLSCYTKNNIFGKENIIDFLLENNLGKYILFLFKKIRNIEDLKESKKIFFLLCLNNRNRYTLSIAKKIYKSGKYSNIKIRTIYLFYDIGKRFGINIGNIDFINDKHPFSLLKSKGGKKGQKLLEDMYKNGFINYLFRNRQDLMFKLEIMEIFYEMGLGVNLKELKNLYFSMDPYEKGDGEDFIKQKVLGIIISKGGKTFAKKIYFKTNDFYEKISIIYLLYNYEKDISLIDDLIQQYNNFLIEEKQEFLEILLKINIIENIKKIYFIEKNKKIKKYILCGFLKIGGEKNRKFVQKELGIKNKELVDWYWENKE